jgi:hypothetical protein
VALFLFLILVAVVLGILGEVVKGLLFLLFIGIVVFLVAFLFVGWRLRRRWRHTPTR